MLSLRDRYCNVIITFIKIVVLYPKLIILVPILLVFLLSYPVSYDFSIKSINASIAKLWLYGPELHDLYLSHEVAERIRIASFDDSTLTRLTFESSLSTGNVLDLDYLRQLSSLQQNISLQFPHAIIASPLNTWPGLEPGQLQSQDNNYYLLDYLNHKRTHLQISIYLNDVDTENHLFKSAHRINMYIVYRDTDLLSTVSSMVAAYRDIDLVETVSTTNVKSIIDFGRFYIRENTKSPYSCLLHILFVLEAVLHGSIFLFIYLCIANQHNIRAVFQLICGWATEILVSATAAVNIVRIMNGYETWEITFQPLTSCSRLSYVVIIVMLSSRNLLRTIDDLNCRNSYESSSGIHKRLFRFYTGSSLLRTGNNIKIRILKWFFAGFSGNEGETILIPNITKIMIVNYFGLFLLYSLLRGVFTITLNGNHLQYLLSRLKRFFQAICISLFIDQVLQLTYLTGIIIIDQKRLELADLLEYEKDSEDQIENRIHDTNALSLFLLKLKLPPHLRPHRGSWRYKLGRFLLTVRYVDLIRPWLIIVPLIALVYVLGVAVSWSLLIPFVLMNDENNVLNLGQIRMHNTNNHVYYLEQVLIVVFFIAITNLIFSITNAESHAVSQSRSLSTDKNEVVISWGDEMKQFKSIDLAAGHDIDVASITTNINCPFMITVGLDKKVLVWSPLIKPVPRPIDISTTISVSPTKSRLFWPINHISISNDGNLIVLISCRFSKIKLFQRSSMKYLWEQDLLDEFSPEVVSKKRPKILESFFRRRTVPGLLARMILERKKRSKVGRRTSATSMTSSTSQINSDFSVPEGSDMTTIEELPEALAGMQHDNSLPEDDINSDPLIEDEYLMVLDNGHFITISCQSGTMKVVNLLAESYQSSSGLKILSAKRLVTPRVRDRIICHISNADILVVTVINNQWGCRIMDVQREIYNKEISEYFSVVPIPPPKIYNPATDSFDSPSDSSNRTNHSLETAKLPRLTSKAVFNSAIATVDFVGMVLVVNRMVAELIDVLTGVVLRSFGIGHFKHLSFRVSHLEPTHCKFCGCASIQSLSILYEDYYSNTLMIHTFHTDGKRAKSNICLRVERDPREIRCQGFEAVKEDIHWIDNVEKWEVTNINMVIGVQKPVDITTIDEPNHSDSVQDTTNSFQLRSRKRSHITKPTSNNFAATNKWTGFIVSAANGKKIDYQIPFNKDTPPMIANKINCVRPYGYKSVALTFGNLTKIIYLGNNKLIENELYFSGTDADSAVDSILEEEELQLASDHTNGLPREAKTVNSELLFINKRRKMRDKSARRFQ